MNPAMLAAVNVCSRKMENGTSGSRTRSSQTTNAAGQPVVIYDPTTGQPFAGNIIPFSRLNNVALAMTKYLPMPDLERSNGSANYTRTSLINNKFQQLYSAKVDHKFSDAVTLSGFYLYNHTDEPDANYFGTATQTAMATTPMMRDPSNP